MAGTGYKLEAIPRSSHPISPVFPKESSQVQKNYETCRNGGYNRRIHCFNLVSGPDDAVVGFAGLTRGIEDLGIELNAYVCIEHMFLRADLRRRGLGRLMMDDLYNRITEWLDACAAAAILNGQAFRVHSANDIISPEGRAVITRLDQCLSAYCHAKGWEFCTSTPYIV